MDKPQRSDAGGTLLRSFFGVLEWLGWCVVAPVVAVGIWVAVEPHGNMWLAPALLTAIPLSLFGAWRVAKRPAVRRSFILSPVVVLCSVAAGLASAACASGVVSLFLFLEQAP